MRCRDPPGGGSFLHEGGQTPAVAGITRAHCGSSGGSVQCWALTAVTVAPIIDVSAAGNQRD